MSDTPQVALDVHALQVEGFADRGIGRYAAGFAAAFARAGRVAAALLAPELPPPAGLPGDLVAMDLVRWDSIAEARRILKRPARVAYHVLAPFLHTNPTDPPCLGVSDHWSGAGVPRVVTLHDLIPLRYPAAYLPSKEHDDRYRARARWVASSDLILTNSDHTRNEAIDLLGCDPRMVVTAGAGVSRFFSPPDATDAELWRHHFEALPDRGFILTVGGSDARKGTERAIEALGDLVAAGWDLSLLVAGDLTSDWSERLSDLAAKSGVADRVVLGGAMSDELLRACYRRAAVTLMPSIAEGAGLPVLESAACGTPALASNTTALAETAATPLATFDPAHTESIAGAVDILLSDDSRRAEVLAAQQALAARSTWESVAGRASSALDALFEARGESGARRAPLSRRIALAGPLPPEGGGIGDYDFRLLAALAGTPVEVDAVSNRLSPPRLPEKVGFVSAASLGMDVRAASYDSVVYAIGNSAGHLPTLELALRFPGWVWLHEARLPAIATSALEPLSDDDYRRAMDWLVARAYPGRSPISAARRAGRDHLQLAAAGVGFLAPLLERCRGVLVNSELARRMVLLDLAPLASPPPLAVLPPACPPVRPRRPAPGDPVVASFGLASMSKRPDVLVDACAVAGFRLAFVGTCPPIVREVIEDRARVRGVSARVEVVGDVQEEEWRRWMDRAALAVQLRDTVSGEASAAVLEALAAGVPMLTNVASAGEYPVGTVSLLAVCDADTVATRVAELLEAPSDLAKLTEAGQEFAAAHSFDHLAAALLEAIRDA